METIKCPQCHNDVVNEVDVCPWCGYRLHATNQTSNKGVIYGLNTYKKECAEKNLSISGTLDTLGMLIIVFGTILNIITFIVSIAIEIPIIILLAFTGEFVMLAIGFALKGIGAIVRTLNLLTQE